MIEISAAQQTLYIETAQRLKGSERRRYMAGVVQALGRGGQRYVERTLGWNRRTVRKGLVELTSGIGQVDHFSARGRKRVEARLPHLLADLCAIVDSQPQCQSQYQSQSTQCPCRRMINLSATAIRQQLIEQKGYTAKMAPSVTTIRKKLSELGYILRSARKSHPPASTVMS